MGQFRVDILLVNPDKRRRDLDNRIKPLLDVIQYAEIVEDDSGLLSLSISWCGQDMAPTGCRMVISDGAKIIEASQPQSPEKALFERGREVLGAKAGGLIAKLLKSQKNVVPLARATIEYASLKDNPSAYVASVIGHKGKTSDPRERGDAW